MKRYIDAEQLKIEIDRQKIGYNIDGKHNAEYETCVKIIRIIDSLQQEQSEVDLEKEIAFRFNGKEVSWDELPIEVRKHDYPYYFDGDIDCYPFKNTK